MKDIKILIATHKESIMPNEDIYLPLHVGKEGKEGFGYLGDNTGENISLKNQNYCELTGLYWAWKNLEFEYIGLCHYRRYFTKKNKIKRLMYGNKNLNLILNRHEIIQMLDYDIILGKEVIFSDTIWNHYNRNHHIKDLIEVKEIIISKYPEYLDAFNSVMSSDKMHAYNMFIMKREYFNEYCMWLFDILFELENNIDISNYDDYQKRVFGFISERLFNVWLINRKLKKKEIGVVNTEAYNRLQRLWNKFARK